MYQQEKMTEANIHPLDKSIPNPSVCTIILNFNNYTDTIETIESVFSLDYDSNSVILVENSTDERIINRIRSRFPLLKIIENGKNLGYARGNNIGIHAALDDGAEYVFILNNDVILERDVLIKCINAVRMSPECAACQPLIAFFNAQEKIWSAGTQLFFGYPRLFSKGKPIVRDGITKPPFGLVGCAILFKASALREVGLFDELLFLMHEETDWCFRARHQHFSLLVATNAIAYHKISTTLGLFSRDYLYYVGRNWLLVGRKNCHYIEYLYILVTEITIRFPYYLYHLAGKGKTRWIKYYLWGIIDGLRGISGEMDI